MLIIASTLKVDDDVSNFFLRHPDDNLDRRSAAALTALKEAHQSPFQYPVLHFSPEMGDFTFYPEPLSLHTRSLEDLRAQTSKL